MISFLTALFVANAWAGSLAVKVDMDESAMAYKLESYKIEHREGEVYLYLRNKAGESCRVPIELFKELGVDPLQAAHLLMTSGSMDPILECRMPESEQYNARIADQITFMSYPQP